MTPTRRYAIAACLLLGAAACGSPPPAGPPEIRLGVDTCDGCRMTISDLRYAAAAAAAAAGNGDDRQTLKFDDIGCLARWQNAASSPPGGERWVHDRTTGGWIDAREAAFAWARDVVTPMGSGIAAFRVPADADRFVVEHRGEALTWSAVLDRARAGATTP